MTLSSCDIFSSISDQAKTKLNNGYCVCHIEYDKLEEIIYVFLQIIKEMLTEEKENCSNKIYTYQTSNDINTMHTRVVFLMG